MMKNRDRARYRRSRVADRGAHFCGALDPCVNAMTSRARRDLLLVVLPGVLLAVGVFVLLGFDEIEAAPQSPTFSTFLAAPSAVVESPATPSRTEPEAPRSENVTVKLVEDENAVVPLHPDEFRINLVDEFGDPVVGAVTTVVARPVFQVNNSANDRDLLGTLGETDFTTDEDGALAFLGESGREYELIVEVEGYAKKRYRLRDPGSRRVRLLRPSAIAGYVYTDAGDPIEGIEVEMWHDIDAFEHLVTDSGGYFEFTGVTPHSATLRVRSPFHEPQRIEHVTVEPGTRYIRDFYLRPGGSVSVDVIDAVGEPVADAQVELLESSSGLSLGTLATDMAGKAEFSALRHGRAYMLVATASSGATARTTFLTPPAEVDDYRPLDVHRTLTVAETWTLPVIVDAGGIPIPGARVVAESESFGILDSTRHSTSGMTGEDGRVRLAGLVSGATYSVFVYHHLFATEIMAGVREEDVIEQLPIPLNSPVQLEGVVTTDGASPFANAIILVTLMGADPGMLGTQFLVRTDRFGRYELPNLPAGLVQFEIFDQVNRKLVETARLELDEDSVVERDVSTEDKESERRRRQDRDDDDGP